MAGRASRVKPLYFLSFVVSMDMTQSAAASAAEQLLFS